VDVLLLDKTGTITWAIGKRRLFSPHRISEKDLADAAQMPRYRMRHRRPQHRRARQAEYGLRERTSAR